MWAEQLFLEHLQYFFPLAMVLLRVNFVTLLDESFSTFLSCYDQLRPVFDVNLDLIITSLDILALDYY